MIHTKKKSRKDFYDPRLQQRAKKGFFYDSAPKKLEDMEEVTGIIETETFYGGIGHFVSEYEKEVNYFGLQLCIHKVETDSGTIFTMRNPRDIAEFFRDLKISSFTELPGKEIRVYTEKGGGSVTTLGIAVK